jgi:hypothetical protein
MNLESFTVKGTIIQTNKDLYGGGYGGTYIYKIVKSAKLNPDKTFLTNQPILVNEDNRRIYPYLTNSRLLELNIKEIKCEKTIKEFNKILVDSKRKNAFKNLTNGIVETLGSDPEIFVVDENDKVIPSYEFLNGKDNPNLTGTYKEFKINGNCGANVNQKMFWDGFQAEFNTDAQSCLAWVCDSTVLGLQSVLKEAKKYNPNARLTIQTTVDIDKNVLDNAKPEHVEFGCMPSFNVYNMSGIKADGRSVSFRSAGGHIHFGMSDLTKTKAKRYVKALDKILGVACVSLFNTYDDPRRRTMYGLAGEYRLPAHGLEYRTLSNAWLSHPLIMNLVFEMARKVIGAEEDEQMQFWDSTEEETIRCINTCDVDLAREILARNKTNLINLLKSISSISYNENAEYIYKILMLGMQSIIENPDDISGNWSFENLYKGHCDADGMQLITIDNIPNYRLLKDEKVTAIYEQLAFNIKQLDNDEETMTLKEVMG